MRPLRARLALLAALPLALLPAVPAPAATWTVDPSGGGDATTIQGAVDLASEGDEILILAGTYGEEVSLDKSLTLRSASGPAVTTIDAEDTRPRCLAVNAAQTVLEGLTLTGVNGSYGFCAGITAMTFSGNVQMRDCRVEDNSCIQAPIVGTGAMTVEDSEFVNNVGQGWACGQTDPDHGTGAIRIFGNLVVYRCLFEGNVASDNPLIDVVGTATVQESVIRGHVLGFFWGGLFTAPPGFSATVLLEHNLFVDNAAPLVGSPIYTQGTEIEFLMFGNTFARNDGLFLQEPGIAAGSLVAGNVFTGADVGFALPPGVPVVVSCNDSWGNATNWAGVDPASGANFSAPPRFCAPELDDFTLASNSPLLPGNNACGQQIGAFGEGCGPISIEPFSWSRVKALHR